MYKAIGNVHPSADGHAPYIDSLVCKFSTDKFAVQTSYMDERY